jgi:hypothetical protein
MLRGEQWFPRRAPLSVDILEPIAPSGADFESVLRLRDAVRGAVLARCGEPDLGELTKPASSTGRAERRANGGTQEERSGSN